MKVFSPLFAVTLAAAVFGSSVDAAAPTCSANCADGGTTCISATIATGADKKLDITTTSADTCTAGKRYLKSLKISEDTGLAIAVTFATGSTNIPATATVTKQDTANTPNDCYLTYADVGLDKTLTEDVVATVKCTAATGCTVKYTATFDCKPCAKLCTGDTCVEKTVPQAATKLDLTAEAKCPAYTYSYLKSLVVGRKYAEEKVAVALGSTAQSAVAAESADACLASFGSLPADTAALTADVTATVTCPSTAADCKVQVKPDWACTDAKCPTDTCTTGCKTETLSSSKTSVSVTRPAVADLAACATGQVSYLKSLDVRGQSSKDVAVTFNNGLTPLAASKGTTCVSYNNVVNPAGATADLAATIACATGTDCAVDIRAAWGCYTPPVVASADVYTRISATGANCVTDLSDCSNRCAKSYMVGTLGTDKVYIPQATGDCKCVAPSATPISDLAAGPAAKNAASTMDVRVNTADKTMTIEYTATGKVCKSTYKKQALDNKIAGKTYTRQTSSCEPANGATTAVKCAYDCGAQLTVPKPTTVPDSFTTTASTVTNCVCKTITAVVDLTSDGAKALGNVAAAGSDPAVKYDFTYSDTGSLTLVTTTTPSSGSPTTCTDTYNEWCPMLGSDNTFTTMTIADGKTGDNIKKLDACPKWTYSYLKSLVVGRPFKADEVVVKDGANEATLDADASSGKCYKKYKVIGTSDTTATAGTAPLVTCVGVTGACKVQVKPEWGCSEAKCPTETCDTTGAIKCTSPTVAISGSVEVKRPDGTCTGGKIAYLKSLDVRGKSSKDVVVTFNNNLKPVPASKGATCAYYTNVASLATNATDVVATVACATATAACDVEIRPDWGCYTVPTAAPDTYTRTAADGPGCVTDLSDCSNRCAKSYAVGTVDTFQAFIPQMTTGCTCPSLSATITSPDPDEGPEATNTDAKMTVSFPKATANTMTINYDLGGKTCKSTYKKTAFLNKFAPKTYTRSSVTPESCKVADSAAAPDLCTYKCTAEVTLTKPVTDAINATQTAVSADCPCTSIIAVAGDDGTKANGGTAALKYEFSYTSDTSVTLKTTTTTGSADPVACTAVYSEKVVTPATTTPAPTPSTTAPTPPATTVKTGTSAGVAATGADAGMVTVALMAAAAGAHAGMPVV